MSNRIREYIISESIIFRKTKEPFGELSNMCAGFSIQINDVYIPTVEHLYQACRFPFNPEIQWDIINEKSPMKAKWISRAKTDLSRSDWEQVRFKIMQWAIEVKLSQNWDKFREVLLSTENRNIVEGTNKDKIWGAVKKGDIYIGTNALGRLLMLIRENVAKPGLRNDCVNPPQIPDFLFLGHAISTICKEDYFSYENEGSENNLLEYA